LWGRRRWDRVYSKTIIPFWHPQDTPYASMMLLCTNLAAIWSNEQLPSLITKSAKTPNHNHNIQLPSLVLLSTQLSPISLCLYPPTLHNDALIASIVSYMKYSTNHPPLGTSSRWHSVIFKQFVPSPHSCGEEDGTGCTGKTFMQYLAPSRYPTCIHDIVMCYCGCCALK
jgi:hypothetical protein